MQENLRFCYVAVIRTITKRRKGSGLCEPLWQFQLICQLMTKLETKHILQAQLCDCVSTKTKRETSDASKNQIGQG